MAKSNGDKYQIMKGNGCITAKQSVQRAITSQESDTYGRRPLSQHVMWGLDNNVSQKALYVHFARRHLRGVVVSIGYKQRSAFALLVKRAKEAFLLTKGSCCFITQFGNHLSLWESPILAKWLLFAAREKGSERMQERSLTSILQLSQPKEERVEQVLPAVEPSSPARPSTKSVICANGQRKDIMKQQSMRIHLN
ncbi:hypothetical protein CAPTEDRAFT_207949 [Capitella teleta]|uniref:Uncharacterized protein n=1 Tax=Capitella teleta TaxID=283909 RepID=R7TJ05_CAPTE|nr:hypothetical protein CAPTEDRAFT_207949 [Capitella teleta]|eukprot:ELT93694.1 hypothetical protein CAPTEDRAFT_207949 [Capitella teleta]